MLFQFKDSTKRYKEYRRFEHIEAIEPFSNKKNIKFLKRNRFINFVFNYVTTLKQLQWNQKHKLSTLQVLKRQLNYLVSNRLLYWMQQRLLSKQSYTISKVKILTIIRNKLQQYFKNKLTILKDYYKDAIMSKELYFQENFPQEMLSPHRKRRIFTYIKRIVSPHSRHVISYSKFKMDILYIMTSRTKKKEYKIHLKQMPQNLFMKQYYNTSFYKLNAEPKTFPFNTIPEKYKALESTLSFSLYNLGFFNSVQTAKIFIQNPPSDLRINNKKVISDVSIDVGDLLESSEFSVFYNNRIVTGLNLFILLLLSFKSKSFVYLRTALLRKFIILLFTLVNLYTLKLFKLNINLNNLAPFTILDRSILYFTLVKTTFNFNNYLSWSPHKLCFIFHNSIGLSLPNSNLLRTSNRAGNSYIMNKNYYYNTSTHTW